jgi:hypothetical protein
MPGKTDRATGRDVPGVASTCLPGPRRDRRVRRDKSVTDVADVASGCDTWAQRDKSVTDGRETWAARDKRVTDGRETSPYVASLCLPGPRRVRRVRRDKSVTRAWQTCQRLQTYDQDLGQPAQFIIRT